MARQVLDNGIVLPSEYSDDWYDDMTSNLTKLDEVIGSDAEKLDESDVGAAAISNDYDDLDNLPTFNVLRRAAVTLTAGGTGNYSDLDSTSKIKAGDYVLDAANKLYSITAIDAANSTYTVSAAALINITDKSELGAAALSNSYDDLDDKPAYNILRRASVTLTAGGTGNYTDLDSDSKIKAGDYVLDAANKLYSITAIDAANSTYTVSAAALINITDKSELGAAALSNSYDDLNNLPGYGILRFCSTAITDNSSVAFANISSVSKIAAGDFLLDTAAKLYQITAVDTANETVSVTTPLTHLAVDSSVVHNSGNEDVNGTKTFKDMIPIDGDYLGNESSNNQRTNICLRSNRDTAGKSCAYISRFRQNKSQGALQTGDLQMIGFDVLENEVRTNNVFSIQCSGWVDNVPTKVKLLSSSSDSTFGSSTRPSKINDLNPGALSLPDLNNGIDISGYITTGNTDNNYTPSVDGWIWIRLIGNGASISQGDFGINANYVTETITQDKWVETNLFVTKNVQTTIRCRSITGIVFAKFYPCLGNV